MVKKFTKGHLPFFDGIRKKLHVINTHPLFIGMMVILLNITSKYITIKLSKSQESYLKNSLGRQFLIFAIMWSATRDIIYAFLLTAAFVSLADHLFNEESNFCVIPSYLKNYAKALDTNDDGYVSPTEAEEAIRTLKKLKTQKKKEAFMMYHRN